MLKCPMCRALLPDETRRCAKCQTDLSLLADYVSHLRDGLSQAEAMTRAGELGEAVWAYLAVLEVDPDNATARRQVGKVATAVRQFDRAAPGRRWLRALQKESRWRRMWQDWQDGESWGLFGWAALVLLFLASVLFAFELGYRTGQQTPPEPTMPGAEASARR